MLTLPSFDPAWVDLAQGVRVLHRPARSAEVTAATAWARGQATAMAERLPGFEPSETDLVNLRWGFATIALGRLCITDWQGVTGDCTPDGVAALLALPDMARAYLPHALGVEAVVSAEGNASAPAPTGTTAGAETTAGDAAPLA